MQGAGVSSSEDELVLLLALLDESERGFQEKVLARRWKDVVDELEWWPEAAEATSDASDLRTLRRKWSRIAIVVAPAERTGRGDGSLKTTITQWTLLGVSVGVARLKPAQPFALAGFQPRLGSVESSNRIGGTVGKRLNRPPRSTPSIRFWLPAGVALFLQFQHLLDRGGMLRQAHAPRTSTPTAADGCGRPVEWLRCVTVRACLRDIRCAGETPRLPAAARMKPAGREWTPARGHPRHSACEQPLQTGQGSIARRGAPSATRRYVMLARAPLRQDPAKSRPRLKEVAPGGLGPLTDAGCGF
ncbi:hypothetical protein EV126DRAFT_438587 [Verticillium dahliae]|nr:hypothetical protein EV126DRAFT_438587 [Verticillium dahliae]